MPMTHRLHLLAATAFALLAGCRGCSGGDEPATSSTGSLRQPQSDRARLMSRLNARKLDRDKVYEKDADGRVLCAADADCFVLQAEGCAPASFTHVQTLRGYGLSQHVQARYRIAGREGERCKVERDVLAVDARVDEQMAKALNERGKDESAVERLEADAIAGLIKKHPSRIECSFSSDQVLEIGLNLAESRYDLRLFRDGCRELAGPAPRVGLEEQPAEPAAGEDETEVEDGADEARSAEATQGTADPNQPAQPDPAKK